MVRHKTLRKNHSKKANRRRRATKRKRVEHRVAGMLKRALSFTRRQRGERPPSVAPVTPIIPILGDSNRRRNSVELPGTSSSHRHEPAISGESRIYHNSVLIREGAAALEEIYRVYPKIFTTTVLIYNGPDPFPTIPIAPYKLTRDTTNLYETDYKKHIKPIIDILPKTETFHEDDVLEIMRQLNDVLDIFINKLGTNADIMKGRTKNKAHKEQLMRSIRLLEEMMRNSHADQFFTQHI
jgi:hypothetical protein